MASRPVFIPTPKQIKSAAAKIRAGWSEVERLDHLSVLTRHQREESARVETPVISLPPDRWEPGGSD